MPFSIFLHFECPSLFTTGHHDDGQKAVTFILKNDFSLGEGHPLTTLVYESGELSSDDESITKIIENFASKVYPKRSVVLTTTLCAIMLQAIRIPWCQNCLVPLGSIEKKQNTAGQLLIFATYAMLCLHLGVLPRHWSLLT